MASIIKGCTPELLSLAKLLMAYLFFHLAPKINIRCRFCSMPMEILPPPATAAAYDQHAFREMTGEENRFAGRYACGGIGGIPISAD
jgi:hypothetical protein